MTGTWHLLLALGRVVLVIRLRLRFPGGVCRLRGAAPARWHHDRVLRRVVLARPRKDM